MGAVVAADGGRPVSDQHPPIEYCPPAADVVFRFARSVGEGLGGEFAEPFAVQGLADFMTVVAGMLAHDLNRKGQAGFDGHVE